MKLIIDDKHNISQAQGWFVWTRLTQGRYRVTPAGDHALIWDAVVCVTDDFGNLVRVAS